MARHHQGHPVGFPVYTSWLSRLKGLSGTYPQAMRPPCTSTSPRGTATASGSSLNNVENEIANLWLNYQAGFSVVTSQEVNNGAVSLCPSTRRSCRSTGSTQT